MSSTIQPIDKVTSHGARARLYGLAVALIVAGLWLVGSEYYPLPKDERLEP